MSLFLAKKQEDINQKKVRDLLRLKDNKKCFDCPTKSPAFVNTTIQTFICARCSGLVREVGHRVKAVSASKFSGAEVLALKQGGNGIALKIWLSNYSTHGSPEPESDADVRAFMKQKYYENKWLDRTLLQSHKEEVRALLAKSFTEDGLPIVVKSRTKISSAFARVPLIADSEMNIMNDDEEEEIKEQMNVVPNPYNTQNVGLTLPPPPPVSSVFPVERASMESTRSSLSYKSASSSYSQNQEDYVSSSRRRISSSRNSVTSSGRESLDSTHFSSAASASSSGTTLTAEEIADRCKITVDSNDILPSGLMDEKVQIDDEPIVEQKMHIATQINVAAANKDFVQYYQQKQQQQHQQQQQQQQPQAPLKSPINVNYGNAIQSPTSIQGNSVASASPMVTPSTSKALKSPNAFDSIIMELSGLKLEKTARRATYTGGILSPASVEAPPTPSSSTGALKSNDEEKARPTSMFDPSVFSKYTAPQSLPKNDPYAALRGIPSPVIQMPSELQKLEPQEEHEQEESKEFVFPEEDDEEDWQEFCSSSSIDEEVTALPSQVVQPIVENAKPMIALDMFGDLDPRAMFKRF